MKLVAEQKPPIQWKMTPRNGLGPKMPRCGDCVGETGEAVLSYLMTDVKG
jgi:hypothetical protein